MPGEMLILRCWRPAAAGRCCDECNATVVIPVRLGAKATRSAIEQIETALRMFDPSDPSDVAAVEHCVSDGRRMILLERVAKKLEAQS